ncbi:MAG: hypothetical protein EP311_02085 [Cytophagales bacterium]|nr:MAG: hypothetical protein EP311_02085 [Cytophagales bacterium]
MNKFPVFLLLLVLGWFSCNPEKRRINEKVIVAAQDSVQQVEATSPVTFFQLEDSSAFPDAILELYTPLGNQVFRPGKVPFEFNVKNFPIYEAEIRSPRLFNIINGGDPVGHLSPIFQKELAEGTYRVVGYLVDEQGLALKSFGNYVDRDFLVGESRPFPYSAEPYLALNFPRNAQIVAAGDDLIIDFLVLGGDMKLDGLIVNVEINDWHYEIDHMAPILVENLPIGDYQVKVKLLRKEGKELEGPFSFVTKSVFVR